MIDPKEQLKKLQETIKKNQELISSDEKNYIPEKEDPLNVEHLKENSEFV